MPIRPVRLPLALAAAALLVALPAHAQKAAADSLLTIGHYLDFESVSDPRPSPDGAQIVYTRRYVDVLHDRWETALWIMRADGSRNRFFARGGEARWSPDGSRIAYLAEGEPEGTQVFVKWVDVDGPPTQVTRLTESPGNIGWSPDGKWIAFTMFTPTPPEWKIPMPAAPKGAAWTAPPRIVNTLHYRQDRRGFVEDGVTRLYVIAADGGTPRAITGADWSVGAHFEGPLGAVHWDWSPDGRTIVVDGLADSTADLAYQRSNIYAIDVASGARRRLTARDGNWSDPVFSPDGRRIAYSGFAATSATYHVSALYVMNADGSGAAPLTESLDRDPGDVRWARDGAGVYFTAQDQGTQNAWYAAIGGSPRQLTTGRQMLSGLEVSANGTAFAVRTSFAEPPNLVRFDVRRPGTVVRLTDMDAAWLAPIRLASAEEIRYRSSGGARIQGWIVKPPNFEAGRKYPLILEIHGGPQGMYGLNFSYMFQNFAAEGFVVLFVNPRGSTGYGNAFTQAIERNYPGPDYDDLMAGVDTVIGRGYVDTTSMYVSGCSGGGVLSSWVIGHTNRFAAAAVRCPVIDWISMAGETDVPLFTYSFFAKPYWEDPQPWLAHSSLMYVGNVKTPTLLMTGDLDRRTPIPQTEEYYAALKMRKVPAMMLRFNDEYHGTGSKPSNFMRTQLYMMSWFHQHGGLASSKAARVEAGQ